MSFFGNFLLDNGVTGCYNIDKIKEERITEMKTISAKHNELIGKRVIVDGWVCRISDTVDTVPSGLTFVGLDPLAAQAQYLSTTWHALEGLEFIEQ